MFSDLFINSIILISFLSIGTQIFRERPLTAVKTIVAKVLTGVLVGLLGCILVRYSFRINSNAIIDFRNIPILFASIFSGFTSSVIASVIIGLFRLLYFGVSDASIVGLLATLTTGIGCSIICKACSSHKRKWIYSVSYILIMATIAFSLIIEDTTLLINSLVCYWIANILMSIFLYFYIQFLYQSGESYRRYRDEHMKDFLTGLNNVRQFDNILNKSICKTKAVGNKSLSLIYIDIDFFKKINDVYGHIEGDIVLKEFGKILINTCSVEDLIFRNGGEEFSVILPDCPVSNAIEIAEKIRLAVQAHTFRLTDGRKVNITASIGISSYPEITKEIDTLLEEADNALYTAKRSGRNKVVLSDNKNYVLNF